jgi:hypothetical protein
MSIVNCCARGVRKQSSCKIHQIGAEYDVGSMDKNVLDNEINDSFNFIDAEDLKIQVPAIANAKWWVVES